MGAVRVYREVNNPPVGIVYKPGVFQFEMSREQLCQILHLDNTIVWGLYERSIFLLEHVDPLGTIYKWKSQ